MQGAIEMPKVKSVEKRIWDVEGFSVEFRRDGRDVRGDKTGVPQYRYQRAAKDDMTVADWRVNRFCVSYPGYEVAVLDGDGNSVHGSTKLGNLRDSYEDDGEVGR